MIRVGRLVTSKRGRLSLGLATKEPTWIFSDQRRDGKKRRERSRENLFSAIPTPVSKPRSGGPLAAPHSAPRATSPPVKVGGCGVIAGGKVPDVPWRSRAPPTFAARPWRVLTGGGRETARPPAPKTPGAPSTNAPSPTGHRQRRGNEGVWRGNDPPRRAQSARFPMDGRGLLPLGVVETQEFFAAGVISKRLRWSVLPLPPRGVRSPGLLHLPQRIQEVRGLFYFSDPCSSVRIRGSSPTCPWF